MVHLQRKIKARFAGSVDYLPEGIPTDKFIPVIGYEVRRREYKKNPDDKPEIKEDIYYLVTNNNGKIIPIASFNMVTMIDEKAEIDMKTAVDLLRNVTLIGKRLCELINEKSPDSGIDGVKGKTGKDTGDVG